METRILGRTGLRVSRLGAGLHEIGQLSLTEESRAGRILNLALDGGINFLDTSACYGHSEELIGRTIAHRRVEYILATKCGHAAGGYAGRDWTVQTIRDSIDRSLVRTRTDYLDLLQFHSASLEELQREELTQVLLDARQAGKTRFIGYSGDNEAARWAVESGLFDTLQTSFNLVDQQARYQLFGRVREQEMGLIIKRPVTNGAWGAAQSPSAYAAEYFRRGQAMADLGPLPAAPDNRIWLALAFVLAQPEVDIAIVGTGNPAHMQANLNWVESEPVLAPALVAELQNRFDRLGANWPQLR